MKPSEFLQYVAGGLLIGFILLLLVSQLLGQPAIVFVETGSMVPTLQPNDGYLAVPAVIADDPEVGDVILFESQNLGGGELTTHRVVEITDEGYITQGDANPFTDQDGDEPPVSEGQIKSVALTVGDGIVVIPGLGASVTAVRSVGTTIQNVVLVPLGLDIEVTTLSTVAMVAGLVLFVYGTVTGATDKRQRSRTRGGIFENAIIVIAVLTLVVIIPLNISMLLPSGVYQYEILSSEAPTDNPQIIPVGGESEVTYAMQNSGHLPVMVFLEAASDGVELSESQIYVPRRSTVETSITMQAPDQTGSYLRFIREYRYLVVLPPSLIASLHAIHPIVAIAGINLFVGGIVVGVFVATVGTDRLRLRSRKRELELGEELRRIMPSFLLRHVGSRPPSPPGASQDAAKRGTNWLRSDDVTGGPTPQPPEPTQSTAESATEPTTSSAADGPRSTLTDSELVAVNNTLDAPPEAVGLDAESWSLPLLQRYLFEEYGIDYPRDECKRLLRRAGHLSADAEVDEPPDNEGEADAADSADADDPVVDPELQSAFESAFETKPLRDPEDGESDGEIDDNFDVDDEDTPDDVDDWDPTAEPVAEETLWDPEAAASSTPDSVDADADTADAVDEKVDHDATVDDWDAVGDDVDSDNWDADGVDGNDDSDDWGEGGDDLTAHDDFMSLGAGDGLTDEQYMTVVTALNDAPSAVDVDAETWTPAALQTYLADTYDVAYPRERCVELLRSAGHDVEE
ncbi:signal peptidase I [Halonotius aquaticus]|uniref:Signal peptidase I n=1 Tax=Halonotius aquaticus TaxID=2216978 RepID=A0A3A6PSU9_9EURY|nr:signal peptidase I [Halonotius aquaticus]RJX42586.1 signal peptidase I [Halonotius aquaticus]